VMIGIACTVICRIRWQGVRGEKSNFKRGGSYFVGHILISSVSPKTTNDELLN